jgi:peroxiredoxin
MFRTRFEVFDVVIRIVYMKFTKAVDTLAALFLAVLSYGWLAFGVLPAFPQSSSKDPTNQFANLKATALVHEALEAMGGETKLCSLTAIQLDGIGHFYVVEQSERPEGPYVTNYQQIKEIRDLKNGRIWKYSESRQATSAEWRKFTLTVGSDGVAEFEVNGKKFPGYVAQNEDSKRELALSPERLFFTALESADLRLDKDVKLQGVSNHVIKFTWGQIPTTIYLNTSTNLPTAVETLSTSIYDPLWSMWGDIVTRTYYSYWSLTEDGLRYPYQWDVEKNGYQTESFSAGTINAHSPFDENLFRISEETTKQYRSIPLLKVDDIPLESPNRPALDLTPTITKRTGPWDIAYIRQADGIVILESPISSGYSAKVLDDVRNRFPDQKIKGVITTSDAFPHIGGVREYVAKGIPIYTLDLNRSILNRLLAAPHHLQPDLLERAPRKAIIKPVFRKTVIGSGNDKIELYPLRSESGERMMMIYFPGYKLLYTSDLIQRSRTGEFLSTEYLSEAIDAVRREDLSVENVFGMHLAKTSWGDIKEFVARKMARPLNVSSISGPGLPSPLAVPSPRVSEPITVYKDVDGSLITQVEFMKKTGSGQYSPFPEIMQGKFTGMRLKKEGEETSLGATPPDFISQFINGDPVHLHQLKGRVVVLNFWFVECVPCINEMPDLNKIIAKYEGKGVDFIAITYNSKEQILDFLKKNRFDYDLITDAQSIIELYRVSAFPTHMVIDREGHITFKSSGYTSNLADRLGRSIDAVLARNARVKP